MVEQQWTVNAIKDAVRASGSHWFDPDSMRFFGTRVLDEVYQGPGGIYFVTSEKPPHAPRAYTVRKFTPPDDIATEGDLAGHKTARQAKARANFLAAQGGTDYLTTAEKFEPVSILQQFTLDLRRHVIEPAKVDQTRAKCLVDLAAQHHHLMELLCSDEAFCKGVDESGDHPDVTECRDSIREVANRAGAVGVIFSGDPRGCTVKLTFADGFTNDFAKEGYCVPTSLTEDAE